MVGQRNVPRKVSMSQNLTRILDASLHFGCRATPKTVAWSLGVLLQGKNRKTHTAYWLAAKWENNQENPFQTSLRFNGWTR